MRQETAKNFLEQLSQYYIEQMSKQYTLATQTYDLLKTAFEDKCVRRLNVFIWFNKIFNEAIDDDLLSDIPPTSITNENIAYIRNLARSDQRLTIREMADELN